MRVRASFVRYATSWFWCWLDRRLHCRSSRVCDACDNGGWLIEAPDTTRLVGHEMFRERMGEAARQVRALGEDMKP